MSLSKRSVMLETYDVDVLFMLYEIYHCLGRHVKVDVFGDYIEIFNTNNIFKKRLPRIPIGCTVDLDRQEIEHTKSKTVLVFWNHRYKTLMMLNIVGPMLQYNVYTHNLYDIRLYSTTYVELNYTDTLVDVFYLNFYEAFRMTKTIISPDYKYFIAKYFDDCSMEFLRHMEAIYNTVDGAVRYEFNPDTNCFRFTDVASGIDFAWVYIGGKDNYVGVVLSRLNPGNYRFSEDCKHAPLPVPMREYMTKPTCTSDGHVGVCDKRIPNEIYTEESRRACSWYTDTGNPNSDFSRIINRFRKYSSHQCYHIREINTLTMTFLDTRDSVAFEVNKPPMKNHEYNSLRKRLRLTMSLDSEHEVSSR